MSELLTAHSVLINQLFEIMNHLQERVLALEKLADPCLAGDHAFRVIFKKGFCTRCGIEYKEGE